MKSTGIYARILFILSLIGAVFSILLVSLYFMTSKQESLIEKGSQEQLQNEVNSLILLKTASLKQVVYDYTFWDDFANNIEKGDTTWYRENVTTILKSFHVDYACVYDTNLKIVHQSSSDGFVSNGVIPLEAMTKLKRSRFINFFQVNANGVMEVSAASIHPTSDPTHFRTRPKGYLVLAKIWNHESLKELSVLSSAKVRLQSTGDTITHNNPYSVTAIYQFKCWNGETAVGIIFIKSLNSLKLFHQMSLLMILFLIGSILVSGLVFYFSTRAWINKPLNLVTSILKTGNLKQIEELQQCRGEFKDIGVLFSEFVKQKNDLQLAKEQAEVSEKKVKNILDNSPFHIWSRDADRYNYVNKAYMDFYGINSEDQDLRELRWTKFIHPDDLQRILKLWNDALENNREQDAYFRLMNKQGEYRDFWSHAVPIFNENGKLSQFQGFNIDITERMQAERKILELNQELEMRVKNRTSELLASNKELETFSYSVSHDLKAPLRHINGFIGIFLESKSTALTEEEMGYLKKITNAASEMGRLIDALLSFSRLNLSEIKKTRVRTSVMVDQVIKFFEPEVQNRKITFKVELLPDIEGDESLLRQVWTNLVSNAIKYTGKKAEAIIEIGSISTDSETTFFVKDNGAGFNMKYADKLFGVFQRLHKPRDFEGVGIGLANVSRIITRHGGYCRAEGKPDEGATFYFSLPNLPNANIHLKETCMVKLSNDRDSQKNVLQTGIVTKSTEQ